MFGHYSIPHQGETYTLEFNPDPSLGIAAKWQWYNQDNMTASVRVKSQLDSSFLRLWDASAVLDASIADREVLVELLLLMGATDDQLKERGLVAKSAEEIAEEERLRRFATLPPAGHTPVNCADLLHWFVVPREEFATIKAVFIGDGPFSKDQLLETAGNCLFDCSYGNGEDDRGGLTNVAEFTIYRLCGTVVYVLGRDNWDSDVIDELIDKHEGHRLKFYSQEMFASWLLCGKDPFEAGSDILSAFREGHPALQYLSQGWPGWVTTSVSPSRGRRGSCAQLEITHEKGLLSHMGYHVGQSGELEPERQRILDLVFRQDLTQFDDIADADYLSEWGEPQSGTRLHKMADSIATFCRNRRSRQEQYAEAIADYESDLEWLRTTYHRGTMKFAWPQTHVW